MVMVAVRVPAAVGVNCIVITQLAPGAIDAPVEQALTVGTKSELETLNAAMLSVLAPVLVTVTVWLGADAPTNALANVIAATDGVAMGAPTTTAAPIPVSAMVLVPGAAL